MTNLSEQELLDIKRAGEALSSFARQVELWQRAVKERNESGFDPISKTIEAFLRDSPAAAKVAYHAVRCLRSQK